MLQRILLLLRSYLPVALTFMLFGCQQSVDKSQKISVFSDIVMTMEYRVIIGAELSRHQREEVHRIITQTFDEVDNIYNDWNPQSELSQLNISDAGIWHKLSSELESLLLFTDKLVHLTKKLYDPTVASAHQLWKSSLETGTIPSPQQIQSIAHAVGWNKLHFKKGHILKEHSSLKIDLGGIAKGYCVDLIVDRLNEFGYKNIFVEWGGEIKATGEHPSKRPWNVFISNLSDTNPEHAIDIVPLNNEAIATSGDYLQQWCVDDKIYSHVLNPNTLTPVIVCKDNICSATVTAPSCAIADALATASMLFESTDEALLWAEDIQKEYPSIRFWFVKRDDFQQHNLSQFHLQR